MVRQAGWLRYRVSCFVAAGLVLACGQEAPLSWDGVASPRVVYRNLAIPGDGALFEAVVPDATLFLHAISREVVELIAQRPEDVERISLLELFVEDVDGIAAKSGTAPEVRITLSSRYLAESWRQLNYDAAAFRERLEAVFLHELTHCYSPNRIPYAAIAGTVEGLADAVVVRAGRRPRIAALPGGSWDEGYNRSAFFFVWLDELRCPQVDFIRVLTRNMRGADGSAWPAAEIERLCGTPVELLWDEYQAAWPWPVPEAPLVAAFLPSAGTVFPVGVRPSFRVHVQAERTDLEYNLLVRAVDLAGGDGSYTLGLGPIAARAREIRIEGPDPRSGGIAVPGSASQWEIRLVNRTNTAEVFATLNPLVALSWE